MSRSYLLVGTRKPTLNNANRKFRCRNLRARNEPLDVVVAIVTLGIALTGWLGCGAPSRPLVRFPAQAELDKVLAQRRPDARAPNERMDSGKDWVLQGPFPAIIGRLVRKPESGWELALARAAQASQALVHLTEDMHCSARELGRFYLERQALPGQGLRRFILSFCGSSLPSAAFIPIPLEVDDSVSDDALLEQWQSQSQEALTKYLAGDRPRIAGIWFGRVAKRAVVAILVGEPRAVLSSTSAMLDGRPSIIIEGRILDDAQYLAGHVNQGSYGVADCEPDLTVALPQFRMTCSPGAEDAVVFLQITAVAPGRVLAHTIAQILVKRSADVEPAYRYTQQGEPTEITSPERFGIELLRRLDKVRAAAGLQPVALSVAQSQLAMEVAPYYFSAGDSDDTNDVIALTMLAGRRIKGDIRQGYFVSITVAPSLDVAEWLSEALALPMGRSTLLDPLVEQIAVGAVLSPEGNALAALVTGYAFHRRSHNVKDLRTLVERIKKARADLGLPAPLVLSPLQDEMTAQLQRIHEGKIEPGDALDELIAAGVRTFNRTMKGYLLEAINLNAVTLPDEMLRAPQLLFTVGVTYHKPAGAEWGQLVVLIAWVAPGSQI